MLAVGREDCRNDLVAVTLQGEQALPRGSRPRLRGIVTGCGQHLLAVGREDCRTDPLAVTLQGAQAW